MYLISLLTKMMHFLPGEFSHHLALKGLKFLYFIGFLNLYAHKKDLNTECKNRDITNLNGKLGIAAGLDKNGDYIDCLAALGVDFIEVGTITPRPQKGNPRPRIFRNLNERSLVNRLGFNNKGVDHLVKKLRSKKTQIIIGTSIGKNFDTPNENALEDYLHCIEKVYEYSDYIAINISSPNTKELRELSRGKNFNSFLKAIKKIQNKLSSNSKYVPIFIKISPDELSKDLAIICSSILDSKLDGIICSNTTVDHDHKNGPGGLSGAPLKNKATECLVAVRSLVGNQLPIIASGGVMSAQDYQEKLDAGANLVQIYTGFIYEGPQLIKDILNLRQV